ncbi:hypothetical protein D4764_05G0011310 [Takifugu flavidus]|uniref:Uncharacterized protein n=1 Tax=Takifugu flavidus TaxID=433684 RepID=A0A5C6N3W2_9TELE|nr:hypothetical protein D4764_05G0011310 [Takifugu flavidus]
MRAGRKDEAAGAATVARQFNLSVTVTDSDVTDVASQDTDEDTVSQDLSMQKMKIYSIRTGTSEDPDDVGIVIDSMKVLTALGTFPRVCSMLVGLIYAGTLAYPKELRYTFEVFQKVLLELDCSKLSPKVNSLKNKLLA